MNSESKNSLIEMRKSGFLRRRPARRWRAAGLSRASTSAGRTASDRSMLATRSRMLTPSNGGRPTSISNMIAPQDQRSHFESYRSSRRISGAIYSGEPHSVSAISSTARRRAKPKSAIFTVQNGN